MTASAHLLPANRGRAEEAMAKAVAAQFPVPVPVGSLWSPDECPSHLLPWLAWALSVDEWDRDWPEEIKRQVISESVAIHRRKGTVEAVKRLLRAQGWVFDQPVLINLLDGSWQLDGANTLEQPYFEFGAELIERYGHEILDGRWRLNGNINLDDADHWAEYRLRIFRVITIDQAAAIRRALATVAPARSHLRVLIYPGALLRLDGTWNLGGTFTLGEA